jgi:hypothetical protein
MKIKIDFVTNSSSASFIIPKSCLNEKQIVMIHNHVEFGIAIKDKPKYGLYLDPWTIKETEDTIEGDTMMDNFDMEWFLRKIGVPDHCIQFEGDNFGWERNI